MNKKNVYVKYSKLVGIMNHIFENTNLNSNTVQ